MANFYADEQFPKDTTIALRVLGHDVLTVQEAGNANQKIPDEEVLAFATANDRAVLTILYPASQAVMQPCRYHRLQ